METQDVICRANAGRNADDQSLCLVDFVGNRHLPFSPWPCLSSLAFLLKGRRRPRVVRDSSSRCAPAGRIVGPRLAMVYCAQNEVAGGFMQFKAATLLFVALALPALAEAQTKISGTVKCGKPDQEQKIDIGDKPGHAYAISQGKCTWTKPMTIAGIQTKEDVGTNSEEITSTGARGRGYVLGTMSNGDKFTVRTEGTDTLKDGKPQGSAGTW